MKLGTFSIDEIVSKPLHRYTTGFEYLDIIYGHSEINGEIQYGFPFGKISLWAGSPGVGKTRTAIAVAIKQNTLGNKVLFFQNEVSPAEFKGWVKQKIKHPKSFFVCNYNTLEDQILAIEEIRPKIVVCDSINMIDGYGNPSEIRKIMERYKNVSDKIGCHVVFIGHLNKEGRTKGNNDIEYLLDIVCRLEPHKDGKDYKAKEGLFILTIGKNRYGKGNGWCCFKHGNNGIDYITSSSDPMFIKSQENYYAGR